MRTVWAETPDPDSFMLRDFGLGMLLGSALGIVVGLCVFLWLFCPHIK